MPEQLAENLRAVIAELDSDPGDLLLSPIPGGASRETWLVDSGEHRWVLRRDPEGSVSLVPIGDEFALIERASEAGVPVPQPLAYEPAGGRLGSAGMLMSFVEGTSVAPRILRKPELEARAAVSRPNSPRRSRESTRSSRRAWTASFPGLPPIRRSPRLSRRLRSGDLDDRIEELTPRLAEHVQRKLEIARPGYDSG